MAILPDGDRANSRLNFSEDLSLKREPCALTKTELRDAVNSIDQWLDTSRAALDLALPPRARSGLTDSQKSKLLVMVSEKRFSKGV